MIAKRFEISKNAVANHRRHHMTPQMIAAILAASNPSAVDLEQLQRTESEGLLGSLVAQRARLQLLSEMAFQEGQLHAATYIEARITASLELTSRLLGMIIQHHEVRSTSILVSTDYLKLRHSIIAALKPYPEAQRAVGNALAVLESEAAKEISEGKQPIMIEATPCP